jgi:hypothetical protein
MATSHPHMSQQSTADESEILKFVENQFLPYRVVLQGWSAIGVDIPTPNTNKLRCSPPSSSGDLDSWHVTSYTDSFNTTKLS